MVSATLYQSVLQDNKSLVGERDAIAVRLVGMGQEIEGLRQQNEAQHTLLADGARQIAELTQIREMQTRAANIMKFLSEEKEWGKKKFMFLLQPPKFGRWEDGWTPRYHMLSTFVSFTKLIRNDKERFSSEHYQILRNKESQLKQLGISLNQQYISYADAWWNKD